MENTGTYEVVKYRIALVKDAVRVRKGNGKIDSLQAISKLCVDMRSLDREHLRAYFLDARHNLLGWETISIGTLTASLAHPREILKGAILANSAGFILAHNHPSGDPDPSEEDIRLTKRMQQCANIMGIDLLDHLIVAVNGVYSFKTAGQL